MISQIYKTLIFFMVSFALVTAYLKVGNSAYTEGLNAGRLQGYDRGFGEGLKEHLNGQCI